MLKIGELLKNHTVRVVAPKIVTSMVCNETAPMEPHSGAVYYVPHVPVSMMIEVTKVYPAKPTLEAYPDGSFVELLITGVSSPYPIFGRINHKSGAIDLVNFSYTRNVTNTTPMFDIIRTDVDIERHREEKPHWFI